VSQKITTSLVLAFVLTGGFASSRAIVQSSQGNGNGSSGSNEEVLRRAKNKVQPVYPELARKMNLSGTVKIEVIIAPNGTVKDAKVIGGHPVLADAAREAARKWRFEPAASESTGVIDFKFESQ